MVPSGRATLVIGNKESLANMYGATWRSDVLTEHEPSLSGHPGRHVSDLSHWFNEPSAFPLGPHISGRASCSTFSYLLCF